MKPFTTLPALVRLNNALHCAHLEDSAVLLDSEKGLYFSVNATGATILQGLQQGLSPAAVVDQLMAEYDCDKTQATEDTLAFLNALQQAGLIQSGA